MNAHLADVSIAQVRITGNQDAEIVLRVKLKH